MSLNYGTFIQTVVDFVIIAFAYLGAPRTTRQSRSMSMAGAIGGRVILDEPWG